MGKMFYKSLKIGPIFFLQYFQNKIILNFVKFVATKTAPGYNNFFSSPRSFVAVFGAVIQDPRSEMGKNQDPGSGINNLDPQH